MKIEWYRFRIIQFVFKVLDPWLLPILEKKPKRRGRTHWLTVYVKKSSNPHFEAPIHLVEHDTLEVNDKKFGKQFRLYLKKGHRLYIETLNKT